MFKIISLFIVFSVALVQAKPTFPTQEQYNEELKSAGMSQNGISGLNALSQKFVSQYPIVKSDKEASDKFLAEHTVDVQNFLKSMTPEDRRIYADNLVEHVISFISK